MGTDSI